MLWLTTEMNMEELRDRQGLSLEDVASRMSKSYSTVRNWEAGRTEPTLSVTEMLNLCGLYNCSLEELKRAVDETKEKTGS